MSNKLITCFKGSFSSLVICVILLAWNSRRPTFYVLNRTVEDLTEDWRTNLSYSFKITWNQACFFSTHFLTYNSLTKICNLLILNHGRHPLQTLWIDCRWVACTIGSCSNKCFKTVGDALQKKWIPLHTLAGSGQIKHVVLLLKHSIDVDTRDKVGLLENIPDSTLLL